MSEILDEIVGRIIEARIARDLLLFLEEKSESGLYCHRALLPLLVTVIYRILPRPLVVAAPDETEELYWDVAEFMPEDAFILPGAGPQDVFHPPCDTSGERLKAARAWRQGKVIVVGVDSIAEELPPDLPSGWPIELDCGSEFELESLLKNLIDGGYKREYEVEGWGNFALRGGILDIFPSTSERPVRLEFVGDRIESIREFNLVTQRSGEKIDRVEIFPAVEIGLKEGTPPAGGLVLAIGPSRIKARLQDLEIRGNAVGEFENALSRWGRVIRIETEKLPGLKEAIPGEGVRDFRGDIVSAIRELKKFAGNTDIFLLLEGKGQIERFRELMYEHGGALQEPKTGIGRLKRGFYIPQVKVLLFTSGDLVGVRPRISTKRKPSEGVPISSHAELECGEYVVHADEGIGIFRGLTTRKVLGFEREYLLIEYAEGDRLYVPANQVDRVYRYVGAEKPVIHRLHGRRWRNAKRKAKRSAEMLARRIFELYVERKALAGHAFSKDSPWERELEDSFPYEDTPDQAIAVQEVKRDMESQRVMDRLVCGDVGYGKTEVAVRASFKAVLDSKQVAVLVPTTVLAMQHLEVFRSRLAPFPVRVEMLSRFLGKRKQEEVIKGIRDGEVDIVIGTHRLLQDDVKFRSLGLVVIDEEHRFGVEHKEKLRAISRGVDTLTMTATPIPRTLKMALSGLTDISIINTPPEDRRPVTTYIGQFDSELVKRAINYEVSRGGQVFYVHNRVESSEKVAESLRRMVTGVSIACAHGAMDDAELERVMIEFASGGYDVLVCTAIIESGLDLPNVNTLIVDRADRMGLAQLYQLRGRVGRGERKAFAYFFYPSRGVLSDDAKARLETIGEMTELGSGMKLALRDLEIRGAGKLLGREQSGHIEQVGFELYCEMLEKAVSLLQGKPLTPKRALVEIPVDAYIPTDYIVCEKARVEAYRNIIFAGKKGLLDEFARELKERYGELPEQVENMLRIERIALIASRAGIEEIFFKRGELIIRCKHGKEKVLLCAASSALRQDMCKTNDIHKDERKGTLYLKLRFGEVKNRQEVLLKWLEAIIDDIIETRELGFLQ